MARKPTGVSQYEGRFYRNLGRLPKGDGYAPKKFLLGTDKAAAQLASRRLEQLWADVVRDHRQSVEIEQAMIAGTGSRFGASVDRITGEVTPRPPGFLEIGPVWTTESLAIA